MNRDQTNDRWPVMQHFGTGGDVQCKPIGDTDGWQDCPFPNWNWDKYHYRIKPQPVEVTAWAVVNGPLIRNWTFHETLPLAQAQLHDDRRRGCDLFIVPLKGTYTCDT